MLERDGVLLTWNLPQLPVAWGGDAEAIEATRIADHRIAYLDYEGPVSGGRGTVTRVDGGEYEVVAEDVASLRIRFAGSRCHGIAELPKSAVGS